jgi:hypothetical protein
MQSGFSLSRAFKDLMKNRLMFEYSLFGDKCNLVKEREAAAWAVQHHLADRSFLLVRLNIPQLTDPKIPRLADVAGLFLLYPVRAQWGEQITTPTENRERRL